MEIGTEKHPCAPENAARFLKWVRERGGVAVWLSVNLSNPGASWSTPALYEDGTPGGPPSWESARTPCRVITDPEDVEVITAKEVKRFHVAVRRGSGLSFKLTDGSSRKLRDALAKAGEGSWYQFDYGAQEAVIFVPGEKISLLEWEAREALGARSAQGIGSDGEKAVSQSDG
jgi:hypothetical protein